MRVGFSGICGALCLLLIVLWIRSYWRADEFSIVAPSGYGVDGDSIAGRIQLYFFCFQDETRPFRAVFISETLGGHLPESLSGGPSFYAGKTSSSRATMWTACTPHWFLLILTAAMGTIPWLRSRFSLRTLLIATTVIGLILGLIIATSR